MIKNRFKIILINEGKYDLRQYNITFVHIIALISSLIFFSIGILYLLSDQISLWSDAKEIAKHQNNNKILLQNINTSKEQIDLLLDELEKIKLHDNKLRQLIKLPPIHDDIRKMGYGGIDTKKNINDYNYLLPSNNIDLDSMINSIKHIHRLVKLEHLSYKELESNILINKEKVLSYPAIYPIKNGANHLSSSFGYRTDPFTRKYKFHDGDDFSAPIGTPVISSGNGRVIKSQYLGSFGNYIEIDHGDGYITVYGHLSSRKVKRGEKVIRGQKIGEVGNTGRSTAPHLHYEVRFHNKALDPSKFYFETIVN